MDSTDVYKGMIGKWKTFPVSALSGGGVYDRGSDPVWLRRGGHHSVIKVRAPASPEEGERARRDGKVQASANP